MARIVRNAALCYGCRTCQLVCSFHITGSFWPEKSSIQVSRRPQSGAVHWSIDESCDGCPSEQRCLCVAHCAYGALRATDESLAKKADDE